MAPVALRHRRRFGIGRGVTVESLKFEEADVLAKLDEIARLIDEVERE